jgi:hypothetical protein
VVLLEHFRPDVQAAGEDIHIESRIQELQSYPWFNPPMPLDLELLEAETDALLDIVGLGQKSLLIITDYTEAQHFAHRVDDNSEWREAWKIMQKKAVDASKAVGCQNWDETRNKVRASLGLNKFGQMGQDAAKRSAGLVQADLLIPGMLYPNPLVHFDTVYRLGGAIIGQTTTHSGIYAPPPRIAK